MGIIEYRQRRSQKIQSKQTLMAETEKTIQALVVTLTSMIIVLAGAFLAFTTKGAENGYSFEQIKLKNEDLRTQNSNLKAKLTEITSFANLDENKQIVSMQSIDSTQKIYVTREDNLVK